MDDPARHHRIDYFELSSAGLTAAKKFYSAAFGWNFTDYGPDYADKRVPGEPESCSAMTGS